MTRNGKHSSNSWFLRSTIQKLRYIDDSASSTTTLGSTIISDRENDKRINLHTFQSTKARCLCVNIIHPVFPIVQRIICPVIKTSHATMFRKSADTEDTFSSDNTLTPDDLRQSIVHA
ncbi:hypothetical protein GJ496_004067 [Pomphorhynchus laevis]|nr:hypothetical protein GJ496_004067 [Pomphorhynchus laevis]